MTGSPSTNDLEAAFFGTFSPVSYTAIMRGKKDGTGGGLVGSKQLAASWLGRLGADLMSEERLPIARFF